MFKLKFAVTIAVMLLLIAGAAFSASISMKLSGEGAKNDSTIVAGKNVSLDIYIESEVDRRGLSMGFTFFSPDSSISAIIHPVDSGNGLDGSQGDIKGYEGFANNSMFDLVNRAVPTDWDSQLPENIGFMGIIFKKIYKAHPLMKAYSIEFSVPDPGTLVVDSAFFPPGGTWIMIQDPEGPPDIPEWKGPYKFNVVKK